MIKKKQFRLPHVSDNSQHPTFISGVLIQVCMYIVSGFRIATAAFFSEKPLPGTEEQIIQKLHMLHFTPKKRHLSTGGHFSDLYVRNMGIFYSGLLDRRIRSSRLDWESREQIALRTISLELQLLEQSQKTFTTFLSVTGDAFTGVNMYATPSDSLYAIVYSLLAMSDDSFLSDMVPSRQKKYIHPLTIHNKTKQLIRQHHGILKTLILKYQSDVIDPVTHLIKSDILLSGARDGIKRRSSFYDNVIAWATCKFAVRLGLIHSSDISFSQWKKKIIETFWDKREGIFLDDLSDEALKQKLFSADSLICLNSFFDLQNNRDLQMLEKIVVYIKNKKLDQPFPISYALRDNPSKLYLPVRFFARSYMGECIWSHWGMEYIKALIYLSKENKKYLEEAKNHMEKYKQNMKRFGGYPETYDRNGNLYKTNFYQSVLHSSWVINYEQTKMLLE